METVNQAVFGGIVGYDGAAPDGLYIDWEQNGVWPPDELLRMSAEAHAEFARERGSTGNLDVERVIEAVKKYLNSTSLHESMGIYASLTD